MTERALVSWLWHGNAPVLREYLAEHKRVVIVSDIIVSAPLIEAVEQSGCTLVSLEGLVEPSLRKSLHEYAGERASAIATQMECASWKEFCATRGLGRSRLKAVLTERLQTQLFEEMLVIEALNIARSRYAIEFMVLNEDLQRLPKTAVLWARGAGIPTLHVEHAMPALNPYTIHRFLEADRLLVSGERAREAYVDAGFPAERIGTTGFPAADGYSGHLSRKAEYRDVLVEKYGLDAARPIVVFGTTWLTNRFSAYADQELFDKSIKAFFRAIQLFAERGIVVNAVIKDRHANLPVGQERITALGESMGVPPDRYTFTLDDTLAFVVGGDVVVGIDSALSVEAMLADTVTVNLANFFGLRYGPCFEGDSGVREADFESLGGVLADLLTDPEAMARARLAMAAYREAYNRGHDGCAARRVAEEMAVMALPGPRPMPFAPRFENYVLAKQSVWWRYLNVSEIEATNYHGGVRGNLVEMLSHTPRVVLDIGCAAGGTGALIKEHFPESRVYGLELNQAAARIAATKMDKVLVGKLEDLDLEAEGIAPGTLDVVIVADVLEHMYNPWDVMLRLRPYLSPDAEVVASIPNVRNLALMGDLARGRWRYESLGLLDVTHIRFFTLEEVRLFFQETGYRIMRTNFGIDVRLGEIFERYRDSCPADITVGRMELKQVSRDELFELCALQFYVVASPLAVGATLDSSPVPTAHQEDPYITWRRVRELDKAEAKAFEERMAQWPGTPRVELVVAVPGLDENRVGTTLRSLSEQYYDHLIITVVTTEPLPGGFQDSPTLRWRSNPDLLSGINAVFAASEADWLGVVDAGDQVVPYAFLSLMEAAHVHPEWQVIYTDEDEVAESRLGFPHFKPDFNLELLRGYPYTGGLLLMRRELLGALSGYATDVPGAEDYDLLLRAYEQVGGAGIGHVADALYHRMKGGGRWQLPGSELVEGGRTVLARHLARTEKGAEVLPGIFPGSYRLRYGAPTRWPRVSLLLPAHEDMDRFQRVLEGMLEKTRYEDYEILVVHRPTEGERQVFFQALNELGGGRIRVYEWREGEPVGPYEAYNLLAAEATGEWLCTLRPDGVALDADWLAELVVLAERPGVVAVAPRFLDQEGRVVGGPAILGVGGSFHAAFEGNHFEDGGYFGRAHLAQEISAVTGGGMLVRREAFLSQGGFHADMSGACCEVDLCLRLGATGESFLWTPHVSLLCEGGDPMAGWQVPSEGSEEEREAEQQRSLEALYDKWLPRLARDSAYNPNLSLGEQSFGIETRVPLTWSPLTWRPVPTVLAHYADTMGCGEYRIISPFRALKEAGRIQGWLSVDILNPVEMQRVDPDTILLQRQLGAEQIEAIRRHKRYSRALKVFELDDLLLNLPLRSAHRSHMPKDVATSLREATRLCDRFVVSTEPLRQQYRGFNDDIRVVPNYLERARWGGFTPKRNVGARPRVGWAGGVGHTGDLEMLADVIKELKDEVDWVFFGMCPEMLRPYVAENHGGVVLDQYPAKLASLNLDLALAPLEINAFNEAKSHLRLLEYGILGYPVVCSDIYPYQGEFPVKRVRNKTQDWAEAIREMVADRDACAQAGDRLRRHVEENWMLEDHLDVWLAGWTRD